MKKRLFQKQDGIASKGKEKVRKEWGLLCIAHNIAKMAVQLPAIFIFAFLSWFFQLFWTDPFHFNPRF